MTTHPLAEQVLSLPDAAARRAFLEAHAAELDDAFVDALKAYADDTRHSDLLRSLQTVDLLYVLAELTGQRRHRALGLLADANARGIGKGSYAQAVDLYDEAAAIYRANCMEVEEANAQIGKIYSLANLGRYAEARAAGEWAAGILETHERWLQLATVTMNLAIVYGRQADDAHALAMFGRAREYYLKAGPEGEAALPWVEHNRAMVLCNLGQFDASIQASLASQEMLAATGQRVEVARSQQNLGVTYYLLGRYNEALALLDRARDVFFQDGRERDAILVDLSTSDCLLQLRRYEDVLDRCRMVREQFTRLGTRFEVAQAILNEATAHAGLCRYDQAIASLDEARRLFEAEGNSVWGAFVDLERAVVVHAQGRYAESLVIASACCQTLHRHDRPVEEAQAGLVAAKVLVAMGRYGEARELATRALACGALRNVLPLVYQSRHLMGMTAAAEGKGEEALAEFDAGISTLESLRGRLMIEHRAGFVEDKQVLYEDAIGLCLDLDQPGRGLQIAERAKSRALLDLLAYRVDLEIRPRDADDLPLIEQLQRLRKERDRLYRRWDTESGFETRGDAGGDRKHRVEQDVAGLEKQITDLWHRLLVRHADYACDASLWWVRTEPVQPYLPFDAALLEYFVARDQIIAWVVTKDAVQARRLSCTMAEVQRLAQLLRLNIAACVRSEPGRVPGLAVNARGLLRQLHELLIAPLAAQLKAFPRWVIVPHGPLHYLPFHAFHDGAAFLLERHEISYLPAASLLRYCARERPPVAGRAAFGHSNGGRLPHAVEESTEVANLLAASSFVEDAATVERLREVAPGCEILHLAAHGDFRPDNPLFSGLALAGGWLTTLDIFNLHLRASLVTLSACRTGQSVIGGGDELLGLMRAFLYAGAASLVLSLWAVEDRSTAQFMSAFYRALVEGQPKGAALRAAQLSFIRGEGTDEGHMDGDCAHPYFWAPFYLVGHAGPLAASRDHGV
jgi:CHAT domain-containing protein/tetratricopeptide (TPR) repeat protein